MAPVKGLIVAVVLLASGAAAAQTCPIPDGADPALEGFDAQTRFQFIDARLAADARTARTFNLGWGWGFLGASAAQAGVGLWQPIDYINDDRSLSLYVGAGKAFIGSASQFIRPAKVRRATWDPADPCGSVARAEAAMRWTARIEGRKGGWLGRAEGLALNLAALAILGFGFDLWTEGLISTAVGLAVGEVRLYTYPRGAMRAKAAYRAGDVTATPPARTRAWDITPLAGPSAYGFAIVGAF